MKQAQAVEQWWALADEVTRGRALRLGESDLLPEDMQIDLAMAGVTVPALGMGWDGRPEGYWVPQVLWDFLEQRRRGAGEASARGGGRRGAGPQQGRDGADGRSA